MLRTPGLSGKLEEAWTGHYKVIKKKNTHSLELVSIDPGQKAKKKVVHVNHVKSFILPDKRVN